ncbi:U5 small nuclear ribonucleoprotein TSSC4 [Hemibagrus wyckioides]|nr:U5 small nuclear ribonucleoprotein TSSC4 [Hemibagrus wyckioides]XP_058237546.1 U5 small nuclear ribonucleoprotein TSSC4 [Hemibagrus wyckioides]XP_058237547.1 U5 small nuclear ribonucleoprotein TSSC4 [Hemibagrus wyckioides]XP_058237548.1 U5 small nuclear ribonucleoprotein TSSC4 [Hemibagrus wyckioides]XP_058237550.1 U5 small nuclear ribonucleoprotein TSSC4 [Hemibagrus wyckioides]XP_058237551.1 U5 small nuclear ribonucleoprotein TSSC4 [Hemibagrus wyckioides]
MSGRKSRDDTPNSLSNRDAIDLPDDASLSDSDPDESLQPLSRKVEEVSSSSDEDNVQHGSDVPQGTSTFKLTGGSLGFSFRSRSIFDQLDSAVKQTSSQLAEDNVIDGAFARPAPPSPPMKRKEPERSKKASSSKTVPDYLLHPERWTRYDLDDVPETSDRKNSQVAHEFIQELHNHRRSQEAAASSFSPAFNQDHSSSAEHKIMFSKPNQASKDEGQNLHKVNRAKTKEVGLVHLDDEQEEEEEGGKMASLPHNLSLDGKEKKRKRVDESSNEDAKETNVIFSSGRKVNRKNFRKTVEEED